MSQGLRTNQGLARGERWAVLFKRRDVSELENTKLNAFNADTLLRTVISSELKVLGSWQPFWAAASFLSRSINTTLAKKRFCTVRMVVIQEGWVVRSAKTSARKATSSAAIAE